MTLLVENSNSKSQSTRIIAVGDGIARAVSWTAIIMATPLHFVNLNLPIWLDETWTGTIAAQDTIGGVLQQCLFDVNAPLYYLLSHFCAMIFGISDFDLRLPNATLFAAAALIVIVLRSPVQKDIKLLWAAMVALWIPGIDNAQNARCYGLLLFLATINTVLYARLIVSPQRREAYLWAAISLLMTLTHYYALLLVGTQVLVLLAWHKKSALALWPAALIFLPFPFWMALHLHTVLLYLDPKNAWYRIIQINQLPWAIAFLFNSYMAPLFAGLVSLLALLQRRKKTPETVHMFTPPKFEPIWLVFFAALMPAVTALAMSLLRPSFALRYLIPFEPGLLLGLALTGQVCKPYWRFAPTALLLMLAVPLAVGMVNQSIGQGNPYTFERASEALINAKVKNLVFFWDNPNSKIVDPRQLSAVGGFFFKRAHVPVNVTPIAQETGEDPNLRLIETAKKHNAAILWIFDRALPRTEADTYPVAIEAHDPAYECRNFGDSRYGIFACQRRNAGNLD